MGRHSGKKKSQRQRRLEAETGRARGEPSGERKNEPSKSSARSAQASDPVSPERARDKGLKAISLDGLLQKFNELPNNSKYAIFAGLTVVLLLLGILIARLNENTPDESSTTPALPAPTTASSADLGSLALPLSSLNQQRPPLEPSPSVVAPLETASASASAVPSAGSAKPSGAKPPAKPPVVVPATATAPAKPPAKPPVVPITPPAPAKAPGKEENPY